MWQYRVENFINFGFMKKKLVGFGVGVAVVFGVGLIVLADSVQVIEPGYRGILLRLGNLQGIMSPGLNFKLPFVENVKIVDVRTRILEASLDAASKDLQEIKGIVALNYHLDDSKLGDLYGRVGLDVETRVVKPAIQEGVKAVTAKFTAEELITKREIVKQDIVSDLQIRLANYFVTVDDLSIVNLSFSDEFNKAIEAKQTAAQNALRAENDLRRISIEAQQKIEIAKADAESIRIQGQALKETPGLVQLKMVEKWDGKLPAVMSGEGGGTLINLPTIR